MRTSDFDYDLPAGSIAQVPAARRDAARLLVDRGPGAAPSHLTVADLPTQLQSGDLVVVNTTRVLPARLALRKQTGGSAEVLLVSPRDPEARRWRAMVRPGRRLAAGTALTPVGEATGAAAGLVVVVGAHLDGGHREVTLDVVADPMAAIADAGVVPLPPYITAAPTDLERYQTVFADRAGSVAAPTAGLHLTTEVLDALAAAGVTVAGVELDIGPGTFVPVTTEDITDHVMHAEYYRVPEATAEMCEATAAAGGAVVAVGTTVVRTLESWHATGSLSGQTALFITPGFEFSVVDRLMTNFHQPRSTLLVLLEAFMGPRWLDLYAVALADRYRFLSFGDAMLVDRSNQTAGGNHDQ